MMIKNLVLILLTVLTLSSCSLFKKTAVDKPVKTTAAVSKVTLEEQIKSSSMLIEGIKYKTLGDFKAASETFARAIKINPDNDAAFYELAQIYIYNNDLNSAGIYARTASEIDPSNVWYKQLLAEVHLQKNEHDAAVKIYNKLSQDYPRNLDYLYELARIYLLAGNYNSAISAYDKIEAIIGVTEPISMQKESIYTFTNKPQKAVKELQKLADAFPEEIRYRNMLGQLYMTLGRDAEALQTFVLIKEIAPNDPLVDFSLYELHTKTGQKAEAFKCLKNAFSNPMADIDKKVFTLLPFFDKPKSDSTSKQQAYVLAETLVRVHPEEAKAHSIYGDWLIMDDRNLEARNSYRKVIERDSSRYIVWEQLMGLEKELNEFQALADESSRALELFPEQPMPYYFNGFANYELQKYDISIKVLKSGVNFIVANRDLFIRFYLLIADAYLATSDFDNAKLWLEKSFNHGGNKDKLVLEKLGDIWYKRGDANKAVDYWKQARTAGGDSELLEKKIKEEKFYDK